MRRFGRFKEYAAGLAFGASAWGAVSSLLLICAFLIFNGLPAFLEIGPFEFLTGKEWSPADDPPVFGIFPMICGSVYITLGALAIGVPVGIFTAVFLAYYCPRRIYGFLKAASELLAGIPSIVYGFFGLVLVVPVIRNLFGGNGSSILAASVILGIMILPTIIGIGEAAVRAVPREYFENAVALGVTKERGVFFAVLPAAKKGILAGVVLGLGRAVGETMAVIMVAGNQARMPGGILDGVRTLTANIVIEMGYAADLHRDALFSTALVLLAFILVVNLILRLV